MSILNRKSLITLVGSCLLLACFSSSAHAFLGARKELCVAIGEICNATLEGYGRNPGVVAGIGEILLDTSETIGALSLNRCDEHHVVLAIGRVRAGHMLAYARNPSLKEKLALIAEFCETALFQALTGNITVDVEGLIEQLQEPAE